MRVGRNSWAPAPPPAGWGYPGVGLAAARRLGGPGGGGAEARRLPLLTALSLCKRPGSKDARGAPELPGAAHSDSARPQAEQGGRSPAEPLSGQGAPESYRTSVEGGSRS